MRRAGDPFKGKTGGRSFRSQKIEGTVRKWREGKGFKPEKEICE